MRFELETCTDPQQRWIVAKGLLYTDSGTAEQLSLTDDIGLFEQFSDYYTTSLLKSFHLVFSELITNLATSSFQEGCFRHSFKTALVTPLNKKTNLDLNNLSNYIYLSNISNLLEKHFLNVFNPTSSHLSISTHTNDLTAAITLLKQLSSAPSIMPTILPTFIHPLFLFL